MKSRLAALAFVAALAAATFMSPSIFAAPPPGDGGSTTLPGGGEDPTGSCVWAQITLCEAGHYRTYRGGGTCEQALSYLINQANAHGEEICGMECHASDLC